MFDLVVKIQRGCFFYIIQGFSYTLPPINPLMFIWMTKCVFPKTHPSLCSIAVGDGIFWIYEYCPVKQLNRILI